MSEIISREVVVAIPETFALEQKEGAAEPSVVGKVRVIEGSTAGREQMLYLSLSGGAAEYSMKTLRALGWTCNDITALTGLGSVKADMTGKNKPKMAKNPETGKWDIPTGDTRTEYSIWPARVRPTLRAEDQKAFAAKFKALAAGLKDAIVTVTDDTRAPAELPAAKAFNGANSTAPAPATTTAVTDMFG